MECKDCGHPQTEENKVYDFNCDNCIRAYRLMIDRATKKIKALHSAGKE